MIYIDVRRYVRLIVNISAMLSQNLVKVQRHFGAALIVLVHLTLLCKAEKIYLIQWKSWKNCYHSLTDAGCKVWGSDFLKILPIIHPIARKTSANTDSNTKSSTNQPESSPNIRIPNAYAFKKSSLELSTTNVKNSES